ncbi:MAG: HEAT repeat domain-containing protein [Pirellulales bacterium]|nr:HEAT repeat domain-containing protein [Pirellulales bacterium]
MVMQSFLNQLARFAVGDTDNVETLVESVDEWRDASDADVNRLFEMLPEIVVESDLRRITPVLVRAMDQVAMRQEAGGSPLTERTRQLLAETYRKLPSENELRPHILRVLVALGDPHSLAEFAELVASDPPTKPEHATLALVPIVQNRAIDPTSLYPRLLDGVAHRSAATAILDVTNYLVRHRRLEAHPAIDRAPRLAKLLEGVTAQLEKLEKTQLDPEARQTVGDSVELAVALCDTLALTEDRSVVGKLMPLLELRHRRLQAEAASALARLGEEQGLDHLAALAEHAVVRTRALAYLEELDSLERVDEEFRSADARAEGDLAAWLAEPAQFGFPPQRIELVERRQMFWPGYDDPVECFLYQYVYPTPQGDLIGIGIAGPEVHSFSADMHELEPDDMFAAFAGWTVDHEDCREIPAAALTGPQRTRIEQAVSELESLGYTRVEPVHMAQFFGKELAALTAESKGQPGTAIFDFDSDSESRVHWIAAGSASRPIDADLAYKIHIGGVLLKSFNP